MMENISILKVLTTHEIFKLKLIDTLDIMKLTTF